ncbi:hypothetical protein NL676_028176 [Syzygium grande]|nr:hypothetical protein NL676_028176 [Syzygium grande]
MEDIRLAASLFFEQNPQSKNIALTEFSTLTQTKPGCVTKKAFDEHLRQRCPGARTRPVCGHCKAIVKLVFYTCLQCFADESKPPTYDLCPRCYLANKFSHAHNLFVSNNAMVNNVRKPPKDVSIGAEVATTVGVGLASNALGKQVIDAFLPRSGI